LSYNFFRLHYPCFSKYLARALLARKWTIRARSEYIHQSLQLEFSQHGSK
jgi:hypothetical protein